VSGTPEGLLLVDKPSGPTSHDIVAGLRRALATRRVGHAGTLDPMASGLLPVAIGRATRLIRFLPGHPKVYSGVLRLGVRTDSDDVTGQEISVHRGPLPEDADVRAAAASLTGVVLQVPPAVSAKKIGGRRAYRLARAGREVVPDAVEVEIVRFEIGAPGPSPGAWTFEAAVSGGTYIRALVRDLGEHLGCGGTLAALRRTAVGPFDVDRAVAFDPRAESAAADLAGRVIPLDAIPLSPPGWTVAGEDDLRRFRSGMPLVADDGPAGFRSVRSESGALLGIAEVAEGLARPRVVLAADAP